MLSTDKKSSFERKRDAIEKTLTDEEINTLLDDYVEIDDPTTVELDTHIRYFTILFENGVAMKIFRLGGKLHAVSPEGDYIILKHGQNIIQVEINNAIFYKQLSINEIKKEYEEILDKYEDEIMELKEINRGLYEKITGKDTSMKSRSQRVKKLLNMRQDAVNYSVKSEEHKIININELTENSYNSSAIKKSAMSTKKSANRGLTKLELMEKSKQIRL